MAIRCSGCGKLNPDTVKMCEYCGKSFTLSPLLVPSYKPVRKERAKDILYSYSDSDSDKLEDTDSTILTQPGKKPKKLISIIVAAISIVITILLLSLGIIGPNTDFSGYLSYSVHLDSISSHYHLEGDEWVLVFDPGPGNISVTIHVWNRGEDGGTPKVHLRAFTGYEYYDHDVEGPHCSAHSSISFYWSHHYDLIDIYKYNVTGSIK